MTSTIETGHVKNVANFGSLIDFCKGYGQAYKPIKPALAVTALETKKAEAQASILEVKAAKAAFDVATNNRRNVFEGLKPLATRIVNAFAVSGADPLAIGNLKSVNKKLQGSRTPAAASPASGSETPEPQSAKISTSQQSYDHQTGNFAQMIEILRQHPGYVPNEQELTIESLDAKLAQMLDAGLSVINAYTPYSNAMISRGQSLYDPVTGLVQTAKEVKQYVKSIFGATSPQYKQISGIEFIKIRS